MNYKKQAIRYILEYVITYRVAFMEQLTNILRLDTLWRSRLPWTPWKCIQIVVRLLIWISFGWARSAWDEKCDSPIGVEDMKGWCRKIGKHANFGDLRRDIIHLVLSLRWVVIFRRSGLRFFVLAESWCATDARVWGRGGLTQNKWFICEFLGRTKGF